MFSIDIIKAKAEAKAAEVSNLVEKLNSAVVEANKLNNPKFVKLAACTPQIHALESAINGGVVEKIASVGMLYYPHEEAPVQHALFSSISTVAKIKRVGLKPYIVLNGMITVSAYLITK